MKLQSAILSFLITCILINIFSTSAQAQVFTPIIEDYQCAQLSNGTQFLVKTYANGFVLVKTFEVKR